MLVSFSIKSFSRVDIHLFKRQTTNRELSLQLTLVPWDKLILHFQVSQIF